jgi:hypothetical protein
MPAKADKLTTEQRTEAVYRLILDGWTVERICHNVSSWKISDRQIKRYIHDAGERIKAIGEAKRDEHFSRVLAAAYQVLTEAKTIKDKIAALRLLADLLGLYAPKRTEISGPEGGPVRIQTIEVHHQPTGDS